MKRTEMLLFIAKTLYDQTQKIDGSDLLALTSFEDSKDLWVEDADELLSKMEKLGIRGPHNNSMSRVLELVDEYGWEHEDDKTDDL